MMGLSYYCWEAVLSIHRAFCFRYILSLIHILNIHIMMSVFSMFYEVLTEIQFLRFFEVLKLTISVNSVF